jgi:hypothetical protein
MLIVEDSEASELSELAKATLVNFNTSAQLSSLDTAIMLHREVLLFRPNSHPDRFTSLGSLVTALYARFRRTDDVSNIDEVVSILRAAVDAGSETRPCSVVNLCGMLAARFDKTGKHLDLSKALIQAAASICITAASDLLIQFQQSCQMNDLDTSISLVRQGCAILPVGDPSRLPASNNLAIALHRRFDHLGQSEDLLESILLHREVLELRPVPHLHRTISLCGLADALKTRFDQLGHQDDLDEVISLSREVLMLRPAHPDRITCLRPLIGALYV